MACVLLTGRPKQDRAKASSSRAHLTRRRRSKFMLAPLVTATMHASGGSPCSFAYALAPATETAPAQRMSKGRVLQCMHQLCVRLRPRCRDRPCASRATAKEEAGVGDGGMGRRRGFVRTTHPPLFSDRPPAGSRMQRVSLKTSLMAPLTAPLSTRITPSTSSLSVAGGAGFFCVSDAERRAWGRDHRL